MLTKSAEPYAPLQGSYKKQQEVYDAASVLQRVAGRAAPLSESNYSEIEGGGGGGGGGNGGIQQESDYLVPGAQVVLRPSVSSSSRSSASGGLARAESTYEYDASGGAVNLYDDHAAFRLPPPPVARLEDTIEDRIGKEDADRMLAKQQLREGYYVLRKSRSHPGSYVLVVAASCVARHYPVEALEAPYEGYFSVICPGNRRRFKSLEEVLSYYSAQADGIATRLTKRVTEW